MLFPFICFLFSWLVADLDQILPLEVYLFIYMKGKDRYFLMLYLPLKIFQAPAFLSMCKFFCLHGVFFILMTTYQPCCPNHYIVTTNANEGK